MRSSDPNSVKRQVFVGGTHVNDDVASQMGDVGDHVFLLWRDLRVLDKLVEVLLRDALLRLNVEEYDADFVLDGDVLIEEDGHDVPHVITDAFTFGVGTHGKILFHLAQLVDVSLERQRHNQ